MNIMQGQQTNIITFRDLLEEPSLGKQKEIASKYFQMLKTNPESTKTLKMIAKSFIAIARPWTFFTKKKYFKFLESALNNVEMNESSLELQKKLVGDLQNFVKAFIYDSNECAGASLKDFTRTYIKAIARQLRNVELIPNVGHSGSGVSVHIAGLMVMLYGTYYKDWNKLEPNSKASLLYFIVMCYCDEHWHSVQEIASILVASELYFSAQTIPDTSELILTTIMGYIAEDWHTVTTLASFVEYVECYSPKQTTGVFQLMLTTIIDYISENNPINVAKEMESFIEKTMVGAYETVQQKFLMKEQNSYFFNFILPTKDKSMIEIISLLSLARQCLQDSSSKYTNNPYFISYIANEFVKKGVIDSNSHKCKITFDNALELTPKNHISSLCSSMIFHHDYFSTDSNLADYIEQEEYDIDAIEADLDGIDEEDDESKKNSNIWNYYCLSK